MKRRLFLIVLLQVVSGLSRIRDNPKGFGSAKHVLIIGCDGFGAMYMDNATDLLPNIASFYKTGSHAVVGAARDQMPSVSAPNWSTVICGMSPTESGINSNSWTPTDDNPSNVVVEQMPPISGKGKIPETMWRAAKMQNSALKIAVAESWDWIHYLVESGIVDYEYQGKEDDDATAKNLAGFIADHKPDLMFIHFDSIDDAGHAYGWGSDQYYAATKKVDGLIGELMSALKQANMVNGTLLMLTADHGGWRKGHGLFNQACMDIPALFVGPGVKSNTKLTGYISIKDFAPTALNALGLRPGVYMTGKVVEDIYN